MGSGRRTTAASRAGRSVRRPPHGASAPAKGYPAVPRPRTRATPARPGRRCSRRRRGSFRGSGTRQRRGGPVGEGRCGPSLLRHHQPVGGPVPSHREEPLGAWGLLKPAQPHLEQVYRDGTVSQRQLLVDWSEPAHRAGGDQHPRHQVAALRLHVDAPCAEHVVVADAVDSGEAGGVVDQVSHRAGSVVSGRGVSLRRPP